MTKERTGALEGARVLIVEDEYYLADDLSRVLAQSGAEVLGPVGSLEDAEPVVHARQFDCAVIDMNLRGDFAFELAERLETARIPFVITTGYNEVSLPDALKGVPRVQKPYSPRQVVEMLAALCEKQGQTA